MNEISNMKTAIAPRSANDLEVYSEKIAASGIYGQSNAAAVFTILATGIELGFSAVQSLRAIHVIKGKPTLAASAMMALVKSSAICDYFEIEKSTSEICVVVSKRLDGRKKEIVFEFSIADAKRAKLSGDSWTKYPAAMLRARAISGCARQEYPEILLGLYTPDEISQVESPKNQVEVLQDHVLQDNQDDQDHDEYARDETAIEFLDLIKYIKDERFLDATLAMFSCESIAQVASADLAKFTERLKAAGDLEAAAEKMITKYLVIDATKTKTKTAEEKETEEKEVETAEEMSAEEAADIAKTAIANSAITDFQKERILASLLESENTSDFLTVADVVEQGVLATQEYIDNLPKNKKNKGKK